MRVFAAIGALLPLAIACDSASHDACAAAFSASSAEAVTFCATYTESTNSATAPAAFASACSSKANKLSSACSCIAGSATSAVAASATATSASNVTSSYVSASAYSKVAASSGFAAVSSNATTFATSTRAATTAAAVSEAASITGGASVSLASGGTTCTVTAYADISSAVDSCTNIILSAISAPASSSIDLSSLQTGTSVVFAGETTFGYTEDSDFDPIVISGTDIVISGADGHVINGNGEAYWDGEGSNGGSDKPDHFIVAKDLTNAVFKDLNILNYPVHCFDITGGDGLTFSNILLNNSAGDAANSASDGDAAGHNTDGFDISSTDNMVLTDSTVYNQDDCVAITSGSNITVNNMYCSGGHGLSIGSVGGKSDNVVADITFSNSVVINSENGCRIKSNADTTGSITNIVYSNITLSEISDYGIDIQQDYENGGATGDPTDGVTISGVTFESVTGTMSDGTDYYILCGSDSCSDFTFTDVSITGGSDDSCNYPSSGCP